MDPLVRIAHQPRPARWVPHHRARARLAQQRAGGGPFCTDGNAAVALRPRPRTQINLAGFAAILISPRAPFLISPRTPSLPRIRATRQPEDPGAATAALWVESELVRELTLRRASSPPRPRATDRRETTARRGACPKGCYLRGQSGHSPILTPVRYTCVLPRTTREGRKAEQHDQACRATEAPKTRRSLLEPAGRRQSFAINARRRLTAPRPATGMIGAPAAVHVHPRFAHLSDSHD